MYSRPANYGIPCRGFIVLFINRTGVGVFKNFQVENSDFEKKAAVKDFATTAYLFASSTQASSANEADAYQMYLTAKQNYDNVSAQLLAKADDVRTQKTLTQISDLITKVDAIRSATPAITEADLRAQLADDTERSFYDTYKTFLETRKEYVLESERMIRVKKAQEILNAEIEKRKQIAELKLAAYNKSKDDLIGYSNPNDVATVYNRDKTIATFQAILAAQGPGGIGGVLKGMSYEDDTYMETGQIWFNTYPRGDQPGLNEPAIVSDWNGARNAFNSLNAADKALLDQFRANMVNGQLNSANYSTFKAAADEELRRKEALHESIIKLNWAYGVGLPLIGLGAVDLIVAGALFGAAAAAFASLFGAWAGGALMAAGFAKWGAGVALIGSGLALIIPAEIDKNNKDNDHSSASRNTDDQRNSFVSKLNTIKQKEEEYLIAKAALDYFTKAPSQQVLKDRLVQWGAQAGGYTLSDADLRYVKDDKSNYVDSTGATYAAGAHCPPTGNCTNDAARVLNITSSITTPKFETAAGDKYDPSDVKTQNLESTLQGGFYWLNGEKYVKIKTMAHNGQMTDAYAKYITADVLPGGVWDMYNLGDVMNMGSNHSDVVRTQLKQSYVTAGGAHEQTLMLNEREKTMWSIWNYADAQGKQYKGFQLMAGDYQENSTNVFQVQQAQNASLVTQQWDLRRAELDAARARWENLAQTIESRGTESFNASEQKFLKAWRQWEIDTNRKIDTGKKQWDDKFKTFLTSKQNWQDEIKAAAMEQSLEKMLGATGSALNERLKTLSASINIPVDVPEINVANLVQAAMADFERSKPSNERLFGEINKSITAFNVTLEMGNATHFKGFNSTSLEGDFASNMETFSKKMAILNNVKMYESFKKLIEDFKESLRKNDTNVTAGLTTAATLANYRQDGGWYTKDMGWAFGGKYGFSAYQHADVDGLMNRGMREAGMTQMSGEEMVSFLEKGRDVDVKLFFEVQTMALENAFKIVGGDKSKKGLYGEWVGETPQYNKEGDESDQGSGELGGWAGGQMDNKKTYRGLNKEEKRLATTQGVWTSGIQLTAGLAGALTGNAAVMLTTALAQATHSTGSGIAQGRDVGGTLAMGMLNFGMAFGGAMAGGDFTGSVIRASMGVVRSGIGQNANGTLNLDFKNNWASGAGASALFSGAMSVAGEGLGGSMSSKGWGTVVDATLGAVGDAVQFDSGGFSGFSAANFAGSLAATAAAYGMNSRPDDDIAPDKAAMRNKAPTRGDVQYRGTFAKQMLASEMGKLANAVTTTLVGAMTNDSRASKAFISTYQNVDGWSAMGGILGRATRISLDTRPVQPVSHDSVPSPAANGIAAAAAQAIRRRQEEDSDEYGMAKSDASSMAELQAKREVLEEIVDSLKQKGFDELSAEAAKHLTDDQKQAILDAVSEDPYRSGKLKVMMGMEATQDELRTVAMVDMQRADLGEGLTEVGVKGKAKPKQHFDANLDDRAQFNGLEDILKGRFVKEGRKRVASEIENMPFLSAEEKQSLLTKVKQWGDDWDNSDAESRAGWEKEYANKFRNIQNMDIGAMGPEERQRMRKMFGQKRYDQTGAELSLPLDKKWNKITSEYGWRWLSKDAVIAGEGIEYFFDNYHAGIDQGATVNTMLPSLINGKARVVKDPGKPGAWKEHYGHHVEIENDDYKVRYAHLNSTFFLNDGDEVTAGDAVGLVGKTGTSAQGAHMHMNVFKKVNGKWVEISPSGLSPLDRDSAIKDRNSRQIPLIKAIREKYRAAEGENGKLKYDNFIKSFKEYDKNHYKVWQNYKFPEWNEK